MLVRKLAGRARACLAVGLIAVVTAVGGALVAVEPGLHLDQASAGGARQPAVEVVSGGCTADGSSIVTYTGTVTNLGTETRGFALAVEVLDATGAVLATGSAVTAELGPGQTETWGVSASAAVVSSFTCRVASVG